MQVKMRVKIDEWAKNSGMTKAKIARKSDVTWRTVQRWNRGQVLPSLSNIEALMQLFECEAIDLFEFKR